MMAMLLLVSPGGAPGLTTTALGLALSWPRDVILIDADPCPGRHHREQRGPRWSAVSDVPIGYSVSSCGSWTHAEAT